MFNRGKHVPCDYTESIRTNIKYIRDVQRELVHMDWKKEELDIHRYSRRIETELVSIKETMTEHNQKLIMEFDEKHSILNGVSKARRLKILNTLKLICKRLESKALDALQKEDIENLLLQLRKEDRSNATISDYKVMVKQYFRWLDDEEGKRWKDIKKLCKPRNGEKKRPVYRADDFMDAEERKRFMQAAKTPTEKGLSGYTMCLGSRTSELGNSRIKATEFMPDDKTCAIFHVGEKNKTGYREIKIYEPYTSIIRAYIEQHPLRSDPNAPLLVNRQGKQMSYAGIWKTIKRIAKRANIDKRITPYSFRHMAYTDCQLKGMPQTLIDLRFGHVHGSRMAQKYTHAKFSSLHEFEDVQHGKRQQRYEKREPEMHYCSECETSFSPTESFCPKCKKHCEQTVMDEQQRMKGNFISEENKSLLKAVLKEWATEKGLI